MGSEATWLGLGLPPLHVAPFFLYNNFFNSEKDRMSCETYSEVPHWMHLSFVRYDGDTGNAARTDADAADTLQCSVVDAESTLEGLRIAPNGFLIFGRSYSSW